MSRPLKTKASFVIPVYNGQVFIRKAIESCLNQSIRGIEIIVVDDCSTDNTVRIVKHMAEQDKRVKLHALPHNVGRSLARNTGNGLASGDIIMVLDADDVALPHRAEDTLKMFNKDVGIDVVYGRFQLINAAGDVGGLAEAEDFNIEKVKKTGFTYIGHSTMAYRKSVLEKVSYTDGDYSKNAIDDWKFQIDLHKAGFRFSPTKKILSQYRISNKTRDEKKIQELKSACL